MGEVGVHGGLGVHGVNETRNKGMTLSVVLPCSSVVLPCLSVKICPAQADCLYDIDCCQLYVVPGVHGLD